MSVQYWNVETLKNVTEAQKIKESFSHESVEWFVYKIFIFKESCNAKQ